MNDSFSTSIFTIYSKYQSTTISPGALFNNSSSLM